MVNVLKVTKVSGWILGWLHSWLSPEVLATFPFLPFHRPVTSGKPPTPPLLNELQQKGSKNQTQDTIICTWINQRYCFILKDAQMSFCSNKTLSLLNEISERWIRHFNVSHNSWRWELCWLNLAARKKKMHLQTEFTLNGVPPWWSTKIYQDEVTLGGGCFSSQTMLVFPDRHTWKGSIWTGSCASNAIWDMQSPAFFSLSEHWL